MENEDAAGVTLDAALQEARRCFNCGCVAVNPSGIGLARLRSVPTSKDKENNHRRCLLCGHCAASTVHEQDDLITEIRVPPNPLARPGVREVHAAVAVDLSIVERAGCDEGSDGRCTDAPLVLGAVGPGTHSCARGGGNSKGGRLNRRRRDGLRRPHLERAAACDDRVQVDIAKTPIRRGAAGRSVSWPMYAMSDIKERLTVKTAV